ncbi:MAG: hypothetical protein ACUVXI_06675 [bacterium]
MRNIGTLTEYLQLIDNFYTHKTPISNSLIIISMIYQVLLGAGADVNAKAKYGQTALVFAKQYGFSEIVEMLKEAEAEGEAEN